MSVAEICAKVLREERIHDAAVLVRTRELMKDKKAQKKAKKNITSDEINKSIPVRSPS